MCFDYRYNDHVGGLQYVRQMIYGQRGMKVNTDFLQKMIRKTTANHDSLSSRASYLQDTFENGQVNWCPQISWKVCTYTGWMPIYSQIRPNSEISRCSGFGYWVLHCIKIHTRNKHGFLGVCIGMLRCWCFERERKIQDCVLKYGCIGYLVN